MVSVFTQPVATEVTGWNRKAAGIEMESAGIAAEALAFDQPPIRTERRTYRPRSPLA